MTKTQTLNKLLKYCENQGIELYSTHEGYTEFHFKYNKRNKTYKHQIIKYNKFLPKTFLIYAILHELGHRQVIINNFHQKNNKIYDKNFLKLFEEISAWQEGVAIAKKARIPINLKGYSICGAKALRTYLAGLFMLNDSEVSKIQNALKNIL